MAVQRGANGVEKKKRSKKRRTRTEVSSSSESDSDVSSPRSRKVAAVEEEAKKEASLAPKPATKEKKKKSKAGSAPDPPPDEDVAMTDAPASAPPTKAASKVSKQAQEDFCAIYLRKVAAKFADDLDKVREAPDFKASSVPMLIHALKQGESLFSVEERRRVVGAANA